MKAAKRRPRACGIRLWPSLVFWSRLAAMNDNQRMERRRNSHPSESPMTTMTQLPALVVLERIPVPVLAIVQDGTILFANNAFAEMVDHTPEDVLALKFHQIFHQAATAESVLSAVRALANMIVELAHKDGSVVRALMSRSALMRTDDQIALATFQDLTEQLWADER